MTWYKVDDKLHSHKKAIKAGDAMALWVMAGSWAADQLSDGFVPDYVVLRMFPAQGEKWAERLVEVGLWETAKHDGDDGWAFHQWDDHQPTRSEVESKREAERERKRRQRRGSTGQFEESARSHAGVPVGQGADTAQDSTPSHTVPSRPDPSLSNAEEAPLREDVEAICKRLADRVEGNGVKRPTITKAWRDDARKLIDLDGYHFTEIERVIDWCQSDDFWKSNILSMNKLRKQFGALKIKSDASRPVTLKFDPWNPEAYVA